MSVTTTARPRVEPCRWCGNVGDTVQTRLHMIVDGRRSEKRVWQCRNILACLERQDKLNERERHGN